MGIKILGFCGYEDPVGIPTGFSLGMGWVWGQKFRPPGSPDGNGNMGEAVVGDAGWGRRRKMKGIGIHPQRIPVQFFSRCGAYG